MSRFSNGAYRLDGDFRRRKVLSQEGAADLEMILERSAAFIAYYASP